jgi:hypothetical protein
MPTVRAVIKQAQYGTRRDRTDGHRRFFDEVIPKQDREQDGTDDGDQHSDLFIGHAHAGIYISRTPPARRMPMKNRPRRHARFGRCTVCPFMVIIPFPLL